MFNTIRKIHFVGIGGTGMSGIAEILLNNGYEVSGSDIKHSSIIAKLEKLGAKISIGHNANAVKNAQVLVVSSAINKHNPELMEASNAKIPVIHRSEMLSELMRMKYGILVAGTHGKTTTTSILATTLTAAKVDPTVVIGGCLNSIDSNAKSGQGEIFLAEADESDGSFLRLTPTIAIITNIDKDHMDHYPNFDAIVSTFKAFLDKVPFYGAVCACIDDPGVQLVLPSIRRKVISYGLRQDADISVKNIIPHGFSTEFTPVIFGKDLPPITIKLPGKYNVTNALASFAVGSVLDISPEITAKGITEFAGVTHRFTHLGDANNVSVIDDYAHNPKKIQSVLHGLREAFPQAHICAIFQPHRYSRLRAMGDEFARSFLDADSVIITPVYAAGEQPCTEITPETLKDQIRIHSFHNTQGTILVAQDLKHSIALAQKVIEEQKGPEKVMVITLGAGDVKSVGSELLGNLRKHS